MHRSLAIAANPVTWVAVFFVALLLGMPQLQPVFEWGFPGVSPPVYERDSFFALWLSHWGGGDHPWFDWFKGAISTKHPDRKTLGKALEVARRFPPVAKQIRTPLHEDGSVADA